MPLTLVLGPANSAKAGEVLGAYGDAARRGAVLVVPTAADAEHYGRELASSGAVLGAVLTFSGLAVEIARRTGYGARRLSALQRDRVIRRAVRRARLEALAEAADSAGFAVAAGNLISELERSLVSPPRLARAMSAWAAEDARREPYAREVSALYLAYAAELDALGRVDDELFGWRALDALRADPGRWGREPVFFYGFDDLTPLERDAVETLARVAGTEVTVSLTYEPGRAAFAARAAAVEELRPLAHRVLELPALDDHYRADARPALHHLERYLFEAGAEPAAPSAAVALLEAGGELAEAELVVAEVLDQLRAGVPPEEIVIVCRSVGRGAPAIEDVSRRYGVELAVERRRPFTHTTLGRTVAALARCAWSRGASAEDLLRYLRAPGVLDRPDVADRLEFELRRAGISDAEQSRARFGRPLAEIDVLRGAADPATELARQARRLFALPHRERGAVLEPDAELDARALSALVDAAAELEEVGEQLSGAELTELLGQLEVPERAAGRPGAVLVADPLGIRARRFRAVLICGLQEGAFPLPGVPEPFLSDERRRELATASGVRLGLAEDALDRERYLFYACASRATERLVLSYRSSDEEGNLELPSPFIADVRALFTDAWFESRRRRLLADVVWDTAAAPTPRERARSVAAAASAPAGEEDMPARRLGAVAVGHVRHREVVSGGALETYADCPVRWLVERELAPEPLEPEPEPMTRGSYIHAVLEELIRRLGGAITAERQPEAHRLLDVILTELPGPPAPGRPEPVRRALHEAVSADLHRYVDHEAASGCGWLPAGVELRFGFEPAEDGEPALPAVVLGEGPEQVRLRGVIDRVDVEPGGGRRAIVRDYKSGRRRPEHQVSRWSEDRQLQVALYMRAVRDLLGLDPVAGVYQPIGGGDLRARGVYLRDQPVGSRLFTNDARDPEELDAILDDAAARAVELASRLRAGDIAPCPQTCSRDGCRYPGICRSQ